MKNLKNTFLVLTFVATTLLFGSFTPPNNGNGNIITIDNGQSWIWTADNCNDAPAVPATSVRVMTSSNGFYHVTFKTQLPEGHCDIPAKGAVVTHYGPDSWSIVTSKGKVNAKIVISPN